MRKNFLLLICAAIVCISAQADISGNQKKILKRAEKLCGNVEWKPNLISAKGEELLVICSACSGGSCAFPELNPFRQNVTLDTDDDQVGLIVYQKSPGAEPADLGEDYPTLLRGPSVVHGIGVSNQLSISESGKLIAKSIAHRLGGPGDYKSVPLVEWEAQCSKGSCKVSEPTCLLKKEDVELEEERKQALKIASWMEYPKDTKFFIDRVALMAAAGDEQMYLALTTKFWKLPMAVEKEGNASKASVIDLFQNSVIANIETVEHLRTLGCGRTKYHAVTSAEIESLKKEFIFTSPRYQGSRFSGLVLNNILPGNAIEKTGLKPGDIIVDVQGSPLESPERALKVLRDLEERVQWGLELKVVREGQPQQLKVSKNPSPPPFHGPPTNYLTGKLPVVLFQ